MPQCIVIADEITGGCSVGELLEKNGSSVCSLINSRGLKAPETQGADCLVYSTNSSSLKNKEISRFALSNESEPWMIFLPTVTP